MAECTMGICAGLALKHLIKQYYESQQAFADDYYTDLRTISRYINLGINKTSTIQELADFFEMDFMTFLQLGMSCYENSQ